MLLVVVEGPKDLWVGGIRCIDAGEEGNDGATEEGMGGGGVWRRVSGMGVDDG